jgi:malonate transporter
MGGRDGRLSLQVIPTILRGLLYNPMIVSISLGLAWSALSLPIPEPLEDFLVILGGAATPGALFAIGASLAQKSAERVEIAVWLSFCKLVLHPIFVAVAVLYFFPIDGFSAIVVISAAALPVAGNVFMLAQHYGIAPQRVSAAILLSTAASILTLPLIIALLS